MSAVLQSTDARFANRSSYLRWLPVAVGLAVLYVPTFITLAGGIWRSEEQGHGPLVLLISCWVFWTQRKAILLQPKGGAAIPSLLLLGFGLLCYAVGRSQQILMLEVGSQIPVLAGTLLFLGGGPALRAGWFGVAFLMFMVPLPGFVLSALTGPLKQYVSVIAEQLLYWAGYPIARSGVVLNIGPYQLLVADACSGMHSMYSLAALGAVYLWLMKYSSLLRNAILLAAIIPIAFLANVARVIVLVLVTYHLGDEAGQGFLHGSAGMVLFIFALTMLFVVDFVIGWVARSLSRLRSAG